MGAVGPDPDGGGALQRRATRLAFDTRGLPTASERGTVTGVSDAHWNAFAALMKETLAYDAHGRLTKTALTSGGTTHAVTQYSYDGEGRPECTALRMNPSSFGALPGACTASTLGSFGPDRIARTSYDLADRVNQVTTAYGTIAAADQMQGYTANGLIGWIEDGNGNRSTYEYDGFDRLAKLRYPHPTSIDTSSSSDYDGYTYDAASNVVQERLRDGQLVTYTYDDLNRMTFRNSPGSTNDQIFAYDLLGRMLSVAISGHTNGFSHNALGQLISATGPLGAVGYQYDAGGRRTRVNYPDSFYVQYDYDAAGAMTKVRENGATSGAGVLAVYGYDDLGRRTSVVRGNGVTTTYGYDAASRLISLTHDLPGSGSDLAVTFNHNPAGQITSRTASTDLYSWAGQASPATTTAVNGRNQLTSQGGLSFSYDTRGNMISDGATSYGYDADDRLTTAPGGATLDYDAIGRLYEASASALAATRFLYDGSNLIAEYDASGNLLRRYVHGAGIDEPLVWYEGAGTSDRRWLATDERGSVIAATTAAGSVSTAYTYDEYGIPGAGNAGRFQYTGQQWIDAVGLYHYKSRFYAPGHGRFLQTDRIGYLGGMNLYAYVAGDPVNLVDPFGTQGIPECTGDCTYIEVTGRQPPNPLYRNELRPTVVGAGGSPFAFGGGSIGLGLDNEAQEGEDDQEEGEAEADEQETAERKCAGPRYGDRYIDFVSDHVINVGPYAAALAGGLWPKSWAPATGGRPPALGSTNRLTSVPRAFGMRGAGSIIVRTGAVGIGVATVGIGYYNVTIMIEGFLYAIPGTCSGQ